MASETTSGADQDLLEKIKQSVVEGDREKCVELTQQAVDQSVAPATVLDEGLIPGMHEIADLWERLIVFLPEAVMAAEAMNGGMGIVIPLLKASAGGWEPKGTVVIGTVKGDLHDIGKTIVGNILMANGFTVHDLGTDVPVDRFLDAAEQANANVIACSALMTTSMPEQKQIIEFLAATGQREGYIVIVGGAPTTEEWAKEIAADGWGRDAYDATSKLEELAAAKGPTEKLTN